MAFLDNTGVTRLLNDIKSKFTAPKSIAYVESTTAKTNHAVGSHFMIGEQLKRATSAIATGETIGTSNSTDDTVQDQIDTLRDSVSPFFLPTNEYFTGDLDDLTDTGIYAVGTTQPSHSPAVNEYYIVLVMNWNDRVRTQLIVDLQISGLTSHFYARKYSAGAWHEWKSVTMS